MRNATLVLSSLVVPLLLAFGASGDAQADGPMGGPPQHQHHLTTPNGTHDIGGNTCVGPRSDPEHPAHVAFHNLHFNVHVGVPGTEAFVNDGNPASISGTPCSAGANSASASGRPQTLVFKVGRFVPTTGTR